MRLFLAVELPERIQEQLGEVRRRYEKALPGWRWMGSEGIHLTLRFLGEVRPEDDLLQRGVWRRAAASCRPVGLRIGGLGVFPPKGPVRILWAGVWESSPAGGLRALASAMEEAARAAGFTPESRPFRPHLTLARAARGRRPRRPPEEAGGELGEMEAVEIALFQSRLSTAGASCTRLEAFPLGPTHVG